MVPDLNAGIIGNRRSNGACAGFSRRKCEDETLQAFLCLRAFFWRKALTARSRRSNQRFHKSKTGGTFMNQTEHYKLSQWALSDNIRMADFNADNAKLDAALNGLASSKLEFVSLLDNFKTATGKTSCVFNFTGVKPWECLAVFIRIDVNSSLPIDVYAGNTSTPFGTDLSYSSSFVLFPMRDENSYMAFLPIGNSGTTIVPVKNFVTDFTCLTFRYGNWQSFSADIYARVTGIR